MLRQTAGAILTNCLAQARFLQQAGGAAEWGETLSASCFRRKTLRIAPICSTELSCTKDGVKANLHAVLDYLVSAEMTDLEWVIASTPVFYWNLNQRLRQTLLTKLFFGGFLCQPSSFQRAGSPGKGKRGCDNVVTVCHSRRFPAVSGFILFNTYTAWSQEL